MFDKLSKNQKTILWFFIVISWLFVLPLIVWIGIFIGYNMCKNSMKLEMENILKNESNNPIDDNYLEINV